MHADEDYSSMRATKRYKKCACLPVEIVLFILSLADERDVVVPCSRVCRLWYTCSRDEVVWKKLIAGNQDVEHYYKLVTNSWYKAGMWYLKSFMIRFDDRICLNKEGCGHYTFANGESYFGEWRDNKFDGYGLCLWSDGRKYRGMFKEGKRYGFGMFTWPSGCKYEGEWLDDKRHGSGKDLWPDSSSFVGQYAQDKFNGWGVFKWEDGGHYEGNWKEDRRHGFGIHTWKDGRIFRGEFNEDKFMGEVEYTANGGTD